jgi:hypothetical protein
MTLKQFRASRRIPPADIDPWMIPGSLDRAARPATEEYIYQADHGPVWVRCESGQYRFNWKESAACRATLAEAETALFERVK